MHAHCRRKVGDVVGGRGRDAAAEGGGLDLRAVGGGAALFDDGVELADGLVDVGVGAAETAGSCGRGVGAAAGG